MGKIKRNGNNAKWEKAISAVSLWKFCTVLALHLVHVVCVIDLRLLGEVIMVTAHAFSSCKHHHV
jgi:hypothetical protein